MKYFPAFRRLLLPALLLGSLGLASCNCDRDPKPDKNKANSSANE